MLAITSCSTFSSYALPRLVISLSLCCLPLLDDEVEETTNPSNKFLSVATSTSFANYFSVDVDNQPVDEDTCDDDFLELHEATKEGL